MAAVSLADLDARRLTGLDGEPRRGDYPTAILKCHPEQIGFCSGFGRNRRRRDQARR
jgi:hypothetical protein